MFYPDGRGKMDENMLVWCLPINTFNAIIARSGLSEEQCVVCDQLILVQDVSFPASCVHCGYIPTREE